MRDLFVYLLQLGHFAKWEVGFGSKSAYKKSIILKFYDKVGSVKDVSNTLILKFPAEICYVYNAFFDKFYYWFVILSIATSCADSIQNAG